MITRIEAKNYRSLRYVSQEVKPFQVLIGPNASGKSTFLDVVAFMGDIVRYGVKEACDRRSRNYDDLTFNRKGGPIELAIEYQPYEGQYYEVPSLPFVLKGSEDNTSSLISNIKFRYELKIIQEGYQLHKIVGERLLLIDISKEEKYTTFENENVFEKTPRKIYSSYLQRSENSNISLRAVDKGNKLAGYILDSDKSGLSSVIQNTNKFLFHLWIRDVLTTEIKTINLDGEALKLSSNPGQGSKYSQKGTNLPWVIEELQKHHNDAFRAWVEHLRSALPDIVDIEINKVPDLNQRYISVLYNNKVSIPSWLLSDGTLRFLALTMIAYQVDASGIYLIEEPENGIHPKILEAVYQSLSSVYQAQIMLATHSPLFLSIAGKDDLLIFEKAKDGSTQVVSGANHPFLQDDQKNHRANLAVLFSSGILG